MGGGRSKASLLKRTGVVRLTSKRTLKEKIRDGLTLD